MLKFTLKDYLLDLEVQELHRLYKSGKVTKQFIDNRLNLNPYPNSISDYENWQEQSKRLEKSMHLIKQAIAEKAGLQTVVS